MRNPCEKMRERIAHLVSGTLSELEMKVLDNHMSDCLSCREYAEALRREDGLLEEFAAGIEADMPDRIGCVINTIEKTEMDGAGIVTVLRSMVESRVTRWAIAAVLVVGLITCAVMMRSDVSDIKHPVVDGGRIEKPIVADDVGSSESVEDRLARELMAELRLVDDLHASGDTDGLIEMLADGQWESKLAAANYLAKIGDQTALMPLVKMVEHWKGDGENPFIKAAKDIAVRMEAQGNKLALNDSAENAGDSPKVDKRTDTTSIEFLHVIEGALDGEIFTAQKHHWFRKPHYYRMEQGDIATIDNGVNILTLDKAKKTARIQRSERNIPISDYVLSLVTALQDEKLPEMYKITSTANGEVEEVIEQKLVRLEDESTDDMLVYMADMGGEVKLWVDAKTRLLDRTLSGRQPGRGEQWRFYYDEIPQEKFALGVPAGFKKLLPPKISGRVVDADGEGMAGFDVYVVGSPWGSEKGTSGSDGSFDFDIPMGQVGSKALRYPLFVRAISDKYPNWVGWTIIQNPNDKGNISDWVPAQDAIEAVANAGNDNDCAGVWGLELVIEQAADISGVVVDRSGIPVVGAEVVAAVLMSDGSGFNYHGRSPANDEDDLYSAKTDSQGEYIISGVPNFEWLDFDETMSDEDIRIRKGRRHINIDIKADANGYVTKSENVYIAESISSQSVDFVLSESGVKVTGRVVNNYGQPLDNRVIYISEDGSSFQSQDWRTDPDGRFEISGAPAFRDLVVMVGGDDKPGDWDINADTKDEEFVYYLDNKLDVGFKDGIYDYDLGDIVLVLPELVVDVLVKNTAGEPIEGFDVSFYDHGMNHDWQKDFKRQTDSNGKCVFENFPNLEIAFLEVRYQDSSGEDMAVEEAVILAILKNYDSYLNSEIELPGDEKGYLVEVVMLKTDEQSDRDDLIRVYRSNGQLVWPVSQ